MAQFSSKISTRGNLWHSSAASFDHQNKSTVHSTDSYWLLTWLFGTFVTSWKVARLLCSDHKPLVYAISKASDRWSPRQQRQLAYIFEFTTDFRLIDGKNNTVADTLSRAGISVITSPQPEVDYKAMAAAQRADDGITASSFVIFLSTPQVKRSAVISPQDVRDLSYLTAGSAQSLKQSMTLLTRPSDRRRRWSQISLCGQV